MSDATKTAAVDESSIHTAKNGTVDVGDQQYVSPDMVAVMAGESVTFDMSPGETVDFAEDAPEEA